MAPVEELVADADGVAARVARSRRVDFCSVRLGGEAQWLFDCEDQRRCAGGLADYSGLASKLRDEGIRICLLAANEGQAGRLAQLVEGLPVDEILVVCRNGEIVASASSLAALYMQTACPNARPVTAGDALSSTLIYLQSPWNEHDTAIHPFGPDDVLVLDNLHRYRAWFASLPAIVTFDLYDIGIAFFNPKLNRQHYIINF